MKINNMPFTQYFEKQYKLSEEEKIARLRETISSMHTYSNRFNFGRIISVIMVYAISGLWLAIASAILLYVMVFVQNIMNKRLNKQLEYSLSDAKKIEKEIIFFVTTRYSLLGAVYCCFVGGGSDFALAAGAFYLAAHCLIFIAQTCATPRVTIIGLGVIFTTLLASMVIISLRELSLVPIGIGVFFTFSIIVAVKQMIWQIETRFDLNKELLKRVQEADANLARYDAEKLIREKLESAAGVGIYNWNYQDNTHFWSRGTFDVVGIEDVSQVPNKEDFIARLHPKDRQNYLDTARKARIEKTPFSVEFSIMGDDGQYRHVFYHGESVFDENNNVTGSTGIVVNQTKIKNSLAKTKRAREILQMALNFSKSVVIEKDFKTGEINVFGALDDSLNASKIISSNKYTPQEIEKIIFSGLDEVGFEILQDLLDKAEATKESQSGLHRYQLPNGEMIDCRVSIFVEGEISKNNGRMISITTNISEDIKRQNQLLNIISKESKTRSLLQTALEQENSFVMVFDKNWRCREAFGAYELYGLNAKTSPDQIASCMSPLLSAADRNKIFSAARFVTKHRKSKSFEHKITYPNGEIAWARITVEPTQKNKAGGNEYISISTDITEEYQRREQIRKALEEAQRANRVKSEFLANMSHEIRTPLNGVIAVAGVLSQSKLDAGQKEKVRLIENSGETLKIILNDILDLARVESGRLEIEETKFNLYDALDNVSKLFEAKAQEKGIDFEVQIDESANNNFIGDPTRIKQIVSNLISNAVKFTANGKVTLCATPIGDEKWNFEIKDTGIGISEENLKSLFSRFEQVDGSITREYGGSGLGLVISKSLAKLMGGDIYVNSQIGIGTNFIANIQLLPALSEDDKEASENVNALEDEGAISILAADDNETNRLILEMILTPMGARLVIVKNGQEAVDAFKADKFDIVLMDLQMPVLDGLSAMREIRNFEILNKRQATPLVAVSANAMKHQIQEAYEAGADGHIAKPFTPEGLCNNIGAILDKCSEAQDEMAA
jgi:signal transduction histidine kinase/PAS domain-containing protein/ActR/RegA family two-component response regulator